MEECLNAYTVSRIEMGGEIAATVVVIEPNGDETTFRCVCRDDGTIVDGDGAAMDYMNARYGDVNFCMTVRRAALQG